MCIYVYVWMCTHVCAWESQSLWQVSSWIDANLIFPRFLIGWPGTQFQIGNLAGKSPGSTCPGLQHGYRCMEVPGFYMSVRI